MFSNTKVQDSSVVLCEFSELCVCLLLCVYVRQEGVVRGYGQSLS